ncbi:MAG: protein translocase subunit SecD [Ignavibacteriaceae bacterium]|jgi:preprotein translocase subunit SecD|nr:protein translocase subunit SecD [Ignavibacteriaceae bacterium]HPO56530.1 protein translocase subunit SecD [Ignavibacteriaceae bacterium]
MKELRFRIILVIAAIFLSLYLLYPTFQDYQNTKNITNTLKEKKEILKKENPSFSYKELNDRLRAIEDSIKSSDASFKDARAKRIKLGLDLQGGMRVVLEVNTGKLLEKLAINPDDKFRTILDQSVKEAGITDESIVSIFGRKMNENGIRISRYFGTIRQDDDEILDDLNKQSEDAVNRAMEIINNRINQYGVSEPSISKQGERRVVVELPGVAKEEEARQLLQGTALLEFKLLKDPEFTFNLMQKIDQTLAGKSIDSTLTDSTQMAQDTTQKKTDSLTATTDTNANKEMTPEQLQKEHPFFALAWLDPQGRSADAYVSADNREKLNRLLDLPQVKNIIPNNVEFLYSAKPVGKQEGVDFYMLYLVNKNAELTGGVITDAQANIDPSTSGAIVNMEMNSEGAVQWARITGANIDKRCAIILDNLVFSSPVIRTKITGGRSQIEGMENMEEAKLLEIILKAGALPAPVDVIEERTVGPSLGQDSISKGFNSALFGYIIIGIFMIFWYRVAGGFAAIGLTTTILFLLGVLAGFKATLTLPGIAGIVLTMGMAVDANVLIYERIREELNMGKTLKAAVDSGFSKAYSAIIDSNITTFFTGVILYQFGSGPVQGFALTLMIGILTSLFSALVLVRILFSFMIHKNYSVSIG